MKKKTFILLLGMVAMCINLQSQWNLVWSDEFNYTGAPDPAKWAYDPGPGLYNGELQYYTTDSKNSRVENGNLVMEVKQENFEGRNYTSARLNTRGKASWTYGKFEARIKLTKGSKLWPAFWMMPVTDTYGTWPASGEIDIMEHWSWDASATFGNYHCANYFAKYGLRVNNPDASDNFHLYGVEWTSDKLTFLLDNVVYATYNNPKTGWGSWPFDKPFYLIFNIAVESGAAGQEGTWTKRTIEVDYVRVYSAGAAVPVTGVSVSPAVATVTKFGTTQLTATVAPANASNKDVIWASGNTAIASVSPSGLVTGIADGTVIITATTADGAKTASCTVTVSGTAPCTLLSAFNVPRSSALPAMNASYSNAHVLGSGGPNLGNVTSFQINWDLANNGLYSFALNTNNGQPAWWYDLKPKTSHSFNTTLPACTISGSGIANFDGEYYVNFDGANFVMVAKNGTYAVYISNSSTPPTPCSQPVADSQAPTVPSNLNAVAATTSVALTWGASTDNVAVTGYNVYNGSTLLATVTSLNYTVSALNAATTYTFNVRAKDAAGNISAPASKTVSTLAAADTQAPTTPGSLKATASLTSMALSWNASTDNVGVTGYNVYNGAALVTTTALRNYTVVNLSPSTSYTFSVRARDAAGNLSAAASITKSTTADNSAPSTPVTLTATAASTSVTLNWSASTDNVGVAGYNVYRGTTLLTNVTATSYTVAGLTPLTSYTFGIRAKDAAGNLSALKSVSVTTNAASVGFYSKIEAENYVAMYGIATENCSDMGGTLNVGWIETGDWMAYNINIPAAGVYNMNFRVASPNNGAIINIEKDAGSTNLGSANVPNSGGWQNWNTVSAVVNLPAGQYDIALKAGVGGFNINWFEISKSSVQKGSVNIGTASDGPVVMVYPNPVTRYLTVENSQTAIQSIELFNTSGKMVKSVVPDQIGYSTQVDMENLLPGIYFLKMNVGYEFLNIKVVKK